MNHYFCSPGSRVSSRVLRARDALDHLSRISWVVCMYWLGQLARRLRSRLSTTRNLLLTLSRAIAVYSLPPTTPLRIFILKSLLTSWAQIPDCITEIFHSSSNLTRLTHSQRSWCQCLPVPDMNNPWPRRRPCILRLRASVTSAMLPVQATLQQLPETATKNSMWLLVLPSKGKRSRAKMECRLECS